MGFGPPGSGGTTIGHLFKSHILPIGEPGRDVAGGEAGFALRHLFLRAAQGFPPRRPLRRARQCRVDDFLDLLEAEDEFSLGLPGQIIAQRVVVVHLNVRLYLLCADSAFT
jgi:hypothetical protein